jgi:apolipoprotein D and lipocalin family protein
MKSGIVLFLLFSVSAVLVAGCGMKKVDRSPLQVVPFVDLRRYAGAWYEIARLPNTFQKGCVGSRATYTLRDDGKIEVLNECYEGSFNGRLRNARGKVWVVDATTNAKLKVSFFWPFSGAYWIIDLGKNYEYAVVGHPDRKYLWILSRTKKMDEALYEEILNRPRAKGYDTSKLIKSVQK